MMADQRKPGKRGPAEGAVRPGTQKRIIWDGSDMRSVYANVANVSSGREEIFLFFGMNQSWRTAQRDVKVNLSDRIILSPYAAKRLALLLNNSIRDYESRYGPLELETLPPPGRDPGPFSGRTPALSGRQGGGQKDTWLFQLMKDFQVELGYERSFKMLEKTFLGNRFLLGMNKKSIEKDPHERILDICRRMGMPGVFLKACQENLPQAQYVHFGFEENERTWVYKVYLEFAGRSREETQKQPNKNTPDPFLLHLGFKWDTQDNTKRALARYTCLPGLGVEDIQQRLSDIYDRAEYERPFEITMGVLREASVRMDPQDILYLEVTEDDRPRRSFDINLYKAKLTLKDLYPFIWETCRHYSISSEELHALYDEVENETFGHLSGGIDREGRDFLTVYFGVEGISIS